MKKQKIEGGGEERKREKYRQTDRQKERNTDRKTKNKSIFPELWEMDPQTPEV